MFWIESDRKPKYPHWQRIHGDHLSLYNNLFSRVVDVISFQQRGYLNQDKILVSSAAAVTAFHRNQAAY